MKMKGVEPSTDIEDRTDDPQPQGPIEKDRAGKVISDREDRRRKKFRDTMRAEFGRTSKNGGEYGAKSAELESRLRRVDEEASEADSDAIKAWNENLKKPSKKMKRALKDISDTTKAFDEKKFRSAPPKPTLKPDGYARGGMVRGFGKARGAKPIKVC